MRLQRRNNEDVSLSFLDVICCGFGAIILLLMITKITEPTVLEETTQHLAGSIEDMQKQLFAIRGDAKVLSRELTAKQERLAAIRKQVAGLQSDLSHIKGQFDTSSEQAVQNQAQEGQLKAAKQRLSAEMQRLLGKQHQRSNDLIGGIPVDSEYLIFIIDTSGSMFQVAWPRLLKELIATLDIYPRVKGIQIMNDEGAFMFSHYRGKWIPDTPGRRRAIIEGLKTWNPFSNSSPVEGIVSAIKQYYSEDKKISLYVFGDDFTGDSIEEVMNTVDHINREDSSGMRMVRIHAVGFPVLFLLPPDRRQTVIRFAALMRDLTWHNGGTFVGLSDLE